MENLQKNSSPLTKRSHSKEKDSSQKNTPINNQLQIPIQDQGNELKFLQNSPNQIDQEEQPRKRETLTFTDKLQQVKRIYNAKKRFSTLVRQQNEKKSKGKHRKTLNLEVDEQNYNFLSVYNPNYAAELGVSPQFLKESNQKTIDLFKNLNQQPSYQKIENNINNNNTNVNRLSNSHSLDAKEQYKSQQMIQNNLNTNQTQKRSNSQSQQNIPSPGMQKQKQNMENQIQENNAVSDLNKKPKLSFIQKLNDTEDHNTQFQRQNQKKKSTRISLTEQDKQIVDVFSGKAADKIDRSMKLNQNGQHRKTLQDVYHPAFLIMVNDCTYDPDWKIDNFIKHKQQKAKNIKDIVQNRKQDKKKKSTFKEKCVVCFSSIYCVKKLNIYLEEQRQKKNFFTQIHEMNELKRNKHNKKNQESKSSFIMKPDCTFRVGWDIFCMVLILFEMIMIPFRLSFQEDVLPGEQVADDQQLFATLESLDIYFDFTFLTDIFFNFNTAIYKRGLLIFDRKEITIQYLMCWFWLDLFSSFPYGLVITQFQGDTGNTAQDIEQGAQFVRLIKFFRFIKVIKLLRIAKLKIIFAKIIEYLSLSNAVIGLIGFVRLCLIVLFLGHWFACLWHMMAGTNDEENWLINKNLQDETWYIKYITSIYWAITTMITVGFGDIVPVSSDEKIFAVFTMLVACGVFAYTMNTMGSVLQQIDQYSEDFKKDMNSVNRYLKNKKIPMDMQMRIKKYLEYIYDMEEKTSLEDNTLLRKLSNSLKNDLIVEINGRVIINCPLMVNNFSKKFLYQITLVLQERITIPEELIFEEVEHEYEEHSLYFIQSGEIDIFLSRTRTILQTLQQGAYFGEISFFTDQQRNASAISVDFSNLFYIKRSDFVEILNKYPQDQEKFFKIKDEISLQKDYSSLGLECYSCHEKDHITQNCPSLSFLNVNSEQYSKIQEYYDLTRKKFRRNRLRTKYTGQRDLLKLQLTFFKIQSDAEFKFHCDEYYKEFCEDGMKNSLDNNNEQRSSQESLNQIQIKMDFQQQIHKKKFIDDIREKSSEYTSQQEISQDYKQKNDLQSIDLEKNNIKIQIQQNNSIIENAPSPSPVSKNIPQSQQKHEQYLQTIDNLCQKQQQQQQSQYPQLDENNNQYNTNNNNSALKNKKMSILSVQSQKSKQSFKSQKSLRSETQDSRKSARKEKYMVVEKRVKSMSPQQQLKKQQFIKQSTKNKSKSIFAQIRTKSSNSLEQTNKKSASQISSHNTSSSEFQNENNINYKLQNMVNQNENSSGDDDLGSPLSLGIIHSQSEENNVEDWKYIKNMIFKNKNDVANYQYWLDLEKFEIAKNYEIFFPNNNINVICPPDQKIKKRQSIFYNDYDDKMFQFNQKRNKSIQNAYTSTQSPDKFKQEDFKNANKFVFNRIEKCEEQQYEDGSQYSAPVSSSSDSDSQSLDKQSSKSKKSNNNSKGSINNNISKRLQKIKDLSMNNSRKSEEEKVKINQVSPLKANNKSQFSFIQGIKDKKQENQNNINSLKEDEVDADEQTDTNRNLCETSKLKQD